jgi:hypothetical protein
VILAKTKEYYNQEIEDLNRRIEKEARRKRLAAYAGTLLAGLLGGILLFGK